MNVRRCFHKGLVHQLAGSPRVCPPNHRVGTGGMWISLNQSIGWFHWVRGYVSAGRCGAALDGRARGAGSGGRAAPAGRASDGWNHRTDAGRRAAATCPSPTAPPGPVARLLAGPARSHSVGAGEDEAGVAANET